MIGWAVASVGDKVAGSGSAGVVGWLRVFEGTPARAASGSIPTFGESSMGRILRLLSHFRI